MRILFNFVISVVSTILASLACVLVLPFSPGGRMGARVTRYWSHVLLWGAGIRLRVETDPAVGDGPYIITPNHVSMVDINTCAAAVPVDFHYAARSAFFKMPILGWGLYMGRHVPIDRKRPREAARVLRGLGKRFERGLSVLLFPEGTRSEDGELQPYKRGPFLAAIQHGVAVLPVFHQGARDCLPKGSARLRPGTIRIHIGAPIPTEGLQPPQARELAQRVEEWARSHERDA